MEKKPLCFLHFGNDKRGASVIDIYIVVPDLPLREEVGLTLGQYQALSLWGIWHRVQMLTEANQLVFSITSDTVSVCEAVD